MEIKYSLYDTINNDRGFFRVISLYRFNQFYLFGLFPINW